MYRLLVNNVEYRQATSSEILENLLDRLTARLAVIQEYVPGLGWRDL